MALRNAQCAVHRAIVPVPAFAAAHGVPAAGVSVRWASTARQLLKTFAGHGDRLALVDHSGRYTYRHLLNAAQRHSGGISGVLARNPPSDGLQARVACVLPRNHTYVVGQWAAWVTGSIVVPLSDTSPPDELFYFLKDSGASALVTHPTLQAALQPVAAKAGVEVYPISELSSLSVVSSQTGGGGSLSTSWDSPPPSACGQAEGAMLVYTSGTTNKPKGVLTTHDNLQAQMGALLRAWEWSSSDRILHVLPLHHVHGIMAKMLCAFAVGATVELMAKFDAAAVWAALTRPADHPDACTLFMAVPTVYAKMLEHYHAQDAATQAQWSARVAVSKIRLMVSGSAALPASIMAEWRRVTGFQLLERYGMTEFGMALSNPYMGERLASSVGYPLPKYEVRLVDEGGGVIEGHSEPGELHVRGPGVFSHYWNKPEATAEAFAPEGWFKTGDFVHRDANGAYFVQGRLSADIIKSGGFKLSALEIERIMLEHPGVAEIAVFGVPDDTYGERVAALIVPKAVQSDPRAFEQAVREWGRSKMASYKVPTVVHLVSAIPRNAMGKVNKKELKKAYT